MANRAKTMTPEQEARKFIDDLLEVAGWVIQDYRQVNLGAVLGEDQRILFHQTDIENSFVKYFEK